MRKAFTGYLFSFCFMVSLLVGLSGTPVVFARAYSQHVTSRKTATLSCPGWSIVPSPNVSMYNNSLSSVAAVSSNDVWAVGYYANSNNVEQTLIEHWDGTNWSIVPSPNTGPSSSTLNGVAAASASDVWAVGYYTNSNKVYQTLIEQWDGTNWSIVPSPNVSGASNYLYSVVAVSANNVWAVGYYTSSSTFTDQTLIEHWNGTSWSIVSSPNVGTASSDLYSVTATSAGDIWAVGRYIKNSSGFDQTLTEHWNGTSWSIVSSPNFTNYDDLYGVTAISTGDVWAVGYSSSSGFGYNKTLTEHWNGTSWSIVSSPNVGQGGSDLYSVVALSSSNVTAVGDYFKNNIAADQTLIENWNGTKWSVVVSPNGGSSSTNDLFDVAAVSASDAWAVGDYFISKGSKTYKTLIEHYC